MKPGIKKLKVRRVLRDIYTLGGSIASLEAGSTLYLCAVWESPDCARTGHAVSYQDAMYIVLTEHGFGWIRWWSERFFGHTVKDIFHEEDP